MISAWRPTTVKRVPEPPDERQRDRRHPVPGLVHDPFASQELRVVVRESEVARVVAVALKAVVRGPTGCTLSSPLVRCLDVGPSRFTGCPRGRQLHVDHRPGVGDEQCCRRRRSANRMAVPRYHRSDPSRRLVGVGEIVRWTRRCSHRNFSTRTVIFRSTRSKPIGESSCPKRTRVDARPAHAGARSRRRSAR